VTRYCVAGIRSTIHRQLPSKNQSINRIKEKDDHQMASAAVKRVKKKLPERLAEVRGDRSQRQFARDLGVFQQNVNRYENGTTPHTDFLITLSTKENVSLDWLLLGKGRMRRSR
jgi:DNA-binding transcriptional regulator YiaG